MMSARTLVLALAVALVVGSQRAADAAITFEFSPAVVEQPAGVGPVIGLYLVETGTDIGSIAAAGGIFSIDLEIQRTGAGSSVFGEPTLGTSLLSFTGPPAAGVGLSAGLVDADFDDGTPVEPGIDGRLLLLSIPTDVIGSVGDANVFSFATTPAVLLWNGTEPTYATDDLTITIIPEPGMAALAAVGLALLGRRRA